MITHKLSDKPHGVIGFISFERLARLMKDAGELLRGEEIVSFEVTERGITFNTRLVK